MPPLPFARGLSVRVASHRARICVSPSVCANVTFTLCTWPSPFDVCGKKNGKVVLRELVLDCRAGVGVAASRAVVMGSDGCQKTMWATRTEEMARWDQRLEAGPLAEWRRTLGPDDAGTMPHKLAH